MKTPIKLVFAAFFAVMGFLAAAPSSSAMPVMPTSHEQNISGLLQDVRWGCPRGWSPNRWGRCVRVRRGPSYYYGPRYYRPRYYYGPRYYRAPRFYGGPRWGYRHRHYRRW